MDDLSSLLAAWPDPDQATVAVTDPVRLLGASGNTDRVVPIASISKLLVAIAALVAVEEGTLDLDEPAGPEAATVRHLLAHAAGYGFNVAEIQAPVGTRRIYSNIGIDVVAEHLSRRAGMPFADYQHEAVISALGMSATTLEGPPSAGVHSCVDDLVLLARELLRPTLISPATLTTAVTPQFPDLAGVLPGFGSFAPNPWGLAIEVRGEKWPHWTAPGASPETFGHFGGTGTYLWVDPHVDLATVAFSGIDYGPWANDVWPRTNQAILDRYAVNQL